MIIVQCAKRLLERLPVDECGEFIKAAQMISSIGTPVFWEC